MSKDEKLLVSTHPGLLTRPPSSRGIPPWGTYLAALIGAIYILNPAAGIIELLPDNLPIVGNLDEGIAYTLIWYGLVEFFEGRKYKQQLVQLKSQAQGGKEG